MEAIHRACLLAREAAARIHIVHISSASGLIAAVEARAQGTNVTIEDAYLTKYVDFTTGAAVPKPADDKPLAIRPALFRSPPR